MSKVREPRALIKSVAALLIFLLCLWAAQWQYQRGVDRHARNATIISHASLPLVDLAELDPSSQENEWRRVRVLGTFDTSRQILLRNHYTDDGEYGFELLTAFKDISGKEFWVDCGWVKAPATAEMKPELPQLPAGEVNFLGRLRLNHSLPQGAFFAISKEGESSLIRAANAQAGHAGITSSFYVDLIGEANTALNPAVPAQLPELSDGPHMAYAIQWLFFGSLALYGRYLIRREHLRSSLNRDSR